MKERITKAIDNYNNGYNCAQAILCAYSGVIGLSESQAYKLGEAFGHGRCAACGALEAAFMVISCVSADGVIGSKKTRPLTIKSTQKVSDRFKSKYGSLLCRDILLNAAGVSCVQKVYDAADVLEEVLQSGSDSVQARGGSLSEVS